MQEHDPALRFPSAGQVSLFQRDRLCPRANTPFVAAPYNHIRRRLFNPANDIGLIYTPAEPQQSLALCLLPTRPSGSVACSLSNEPASNAARSADKPPEDPWLRSRSARALERRTSRVHLLSKRASGFGSTSLFARALSRLDTLRGRVTVANKLRSSYLSFERRRARWHESPTREGEVSRRSVGTASPNAIWRRCPSCHRREMASACAIEP
ncbi:hypothetical protein BJY59DRAFT_222528 [Rhodotorula toruloides]